MADVTANGVRHHVQRLGSGAVATPLRGGPSDWGVGDPRFAADRRAIDRPPVVFVHGLVMDNLSSFYFTLANPLARRAEVILYDLRGHGMSERPATGYTVADFVADLAALIDELADGGPVHLVGNSFGGVVALALAAAQPNKVASLALIDAHDGTAGWAAQMAATLALQGEARDAKIAESFQAWLGRHSERKRTRLATAAEALVNGTTLVADLRASPPVSHDELARIACPVLALYGERSDVRARGEQLARTLPRCELVIVPGATHSVLWEATGLVRDRVVNFAGGDA